MTEPVCPRYTTADNDLTLSVDCSVGLLLENGQAREVLGPLTKQLEANELIRKMTLRGILGFAKVPGSEVERLDRELGKIENRSV